jgi:hypothetical protein
MGHKGGRFGGDVMEDGKVNVDMMERKFGC